MRFRRERIPSLTAFPASHVLSANNTVGMVMIISHNHVGRPQCFSHRMFKNPFRKSIKSSIVSDMTLITC